ncbi:MAG TPA: M24 family metallopeptidase [Alphaproteobacteria bacterium]|jgi:Xaa-Pro aminopeptidase
MNFVSSQITPLSLKERDRRYAEVRAGLRERGLDAVVAVGTHLRYLTNGIHRELFGILPTEDGAKLTDILIWRALADISVDVVLDSQDWVTDIRSGRDGNAIVARLKELKLENGRVGYAGGLSQRNFDQIVKALPNCKLEDVSELFVNIRTIKSEEELALMDRANQIFDYAVERIHEKGRPGMLGREVVQIGLNAMWEAGGDLDSELSFCFGAVGCQNPIVSKLCLNRRIQEHDIGTFTSHAGYLGYAGHSDHQIAFGCPTSLHVAMHQAVEHVRERVLKHVRDGSSHRELVDAYEVACAETSFNTSDHSQIHLYGIDVPEFPGAAFKVPDTKNGDKLGGSGNFTLRSGMVFSISPTICNDKTGDSVLSGTSLVVTKDGYRNFGNREIKLLVTA